ncbi:MAG: hypothetical protein IJS54_01035 [Desulfovibrio sp.]|nr:hypothetical protein [Desulfovibrio sp.]
MQNGLLIKTQKKQQSHNANVQKTVRRAGIANFFEQWQEGQWIGFCRKTGVFGSSLLFFAAWRILIGILGSVTSRGARILFAHERI